MNMWNEIKKRAWEDMVFNIVFYGPSTTSYEYVFPNWGEIMRYVLKEEMSKEIGSWKKAYWNIQTMNMGLDGATSKDLWERFEYMVLDKKPDLVFLEIGDNDAYLGLSEQETQENTKKIIEKSLEKNVRVVLITSIPALRLDLNEKVVPYIEAERAAAQAFHLERNFTFVDLYDLFPYEAISKSYSLICSEGNEEVGIAQGEVDPIHCNQFGNALMAKILLKSVFGIDFDEFAFLGSLSDITKKYPEY